MVKAIIWVFSPPAEYFLHDHIIIFYEKFARESHIILLLTNCKTYRNRLSSLLYTPEYRQYSGTAYTDDWTQRRPALDRSHVTHARIRNSGPRSAYNQSHVRSTTWWNPVWRTLRNDFEATWPLRNDYGQQNIFVDLLWDQYNVRWCNFL